MRTQPGKSPYACHSRSEADAMCVAMNEVLERGDPHPGHMDRARIITGYEVRGHSFHAWHRMGEERGVLTWGIWPRWGYTARPDLPPHFGGPFLDIDDSRRYLDGSLSRRRSGKAGTETENGGRHPG